MFLQVVLRVICNFKLLQFWFRHNLIYPLLVEHLHFLVKIWFTLNLEVQIFYAVGLGVKLWEYIACLSDMSLSPVWSLLQTCMIRQLNWEELLALITLISLLPEKCTPVITLCFPFPHVVKTQTGTCSENISIHIAVTVKNFASFLSCSCLAS